MCERAQRERIRTSLFFFFLPLRKPTYRFPIWKPRLSVFGSRRDWEGGTAETKTKGGVRRQAAEERTKKNKTNKQKENWQVPPSLAQPLPLDPPPVLSQLVKALQMLVTRRRKWWLMEIWADEGHILCRGQQGCRWQNRFPLSFISASVFITLPLATPNLFLSPLPPPR